MGNKTFGLYARKSTISSSLLLRNNGLHLVVGIFLQSLIEKGRLVIEVVLDCLNEKLRLAFIPVEHIPLLLVREKGLFNFLKYLYIEFMNRVHVHKRFLTLLNSARHPIYLSF